MLTEDVRRAVPHHSLSTRIPTCDVATEIEHDDPVVSYAVDKKPKAFVSLGQGRTHQTLVRQQVLFWDEKYSRSQLKLFS